nr:protein-glutamate O-methyltransferase CheR [Maritimibacter dapengensis]
MGHLISALTTNVSHFFRESHHFDFLRTEVVPRLRDNSKMGRKSMIWSAGCANGQEPYSIAMVLHEAGLPPSDVRILATDIDPVVVSTARRGRYPEHMTSGLTKEHRARFLDASEDGQSCISADLRPYILFNTLNLLDPWPMQKKFDAIFCRNVVIYFDKQTQSALWQRYGSMLHPNGWLFLGHSERIDAAAENLFEKSGITTYTRRGDPTSRKET